MTNTEIALSVPFNINLVGSIDSTTDQSKIWADRVLSVIGTAIGERVHRFYFGSKIHLESFNGEQQAQDNIPGLVGEAFGNYLPLLSLKSVNTTFSKDTSTLSVTVEYSLPNNAYQKLQVGVIEINGNSTYKESYDN